MANEIPHDGVALYERDHIASQYPTKYLKRELGYAWSGRPMVMHQDR